MALTVIKPSGLELSGNFTVTSLSATANVSAGNVKTDNLLYANGSPYVFGSGTPGGANTQVQYNNANNFAGSANFTFDNTTNTLSVTNIVANGSGLTSLTGANVTGAVSYATTANSVAVGNVSGIGNIATVNLDGNASNILYGNGSFAAPPAGTGYGNANVASFLASFGSNTITTTGNVQVGNIIGNGQALTGLNGANVTGTVPSATTAGTVTTNAQPNITSLGTLTGLTGNGTINFTGASNVSLGEVGNVKITGGSNGQSLTTDGSGNLSFTTITPTTVSNGTSNVNIPAANGNVNISSAGNANVLVVTGTGVNVAGTITATGNITAANIVTGGGAGGNLTGANYVVANYFNGTLITASQPNITTVGTLSNLNVSESIIRIQSGPNGSQPTSNSGKDVGTALNYFDADGDKIAFVGWDVSNAEIALSSNTTITSGVATFNQYANVRANNFIGNGSQLTNVVASTVTTNAQPNITSVGTLSNLTSNGNVNFSNASNISLGSLANIHISGGTANYVLSTDGAGNLTWVEQTGGGGGGGGSVTLSNTTANATFYPVFANATSGNMSTAYLSGSSLTFNPSTGTLTAQDINTLSDAALKDNVEPILDPFEVLKQLFGVGFTWRNTGKKSYGVIAQMIEKILPELVTETPDGKKTVNYIPIIAFLLEAVKKQQEDIDQLKKR